MEKIKSLVIGIGVLGVVIILASLSIMTITGSAISGPDFTAASVNAVPIPGASLTYFNSVVNPGNILSVDDSNYALYRFTNNGVCPPGVAVSGTRCIEGGQKFRPWTIISVDGWMANSSNVLFKMANLKDGCSGFWGCGRFNHIKVFVSYDYNVNSNTNWYWVKNVKANVGTYSLGEFDGSGVSHILLARGGGRNSRPDPRIYWVGLEGSAAQSCVDSDGGQDYFTKGDASGFNATTGATYLLEDSCYSDVYVNEYYCQGDNGKLTLQNCGSFGKVCVDGACVNVTPDACFDSDGFDPDTPGIIIFTNSSGGNYSFVDSCSGSNVFERFCNGTSPDGSTATCPYGCLSGACRDPWCIDSDGGNFSEIQGYSQNATDLYNETCLDGSTVVEYRCSADNRSMMGESINCLNGCSDGACLPAPSCTDTDGGLNYTTQGTVTSPNSSVYVDYCSGNSVYEYYCDAGSMEWTSVSCPFFGQTCSNGRCQ